ncbi:uncharacterized protein BJ171DRAFT_600312 [Polychytrium aggregatum]|uniref:uncharacterized protein n=1 Tax=Polychytrium aggregatum TaxID=110093 RepID=UPI0022FDF39C|nr:uncharacterized protein BJ171DRAFT_600312 [Polychytrium aggregatum]KAI9203163.1 hypothetical protein BJ171DRAFT_600312 [Polychytrium aggregatum]
MLPPRPSPLIAAALALLGAAVHPLAAAAAPASSVPPPGRSLVYLDVFSHPAYDVYFGIHPLALGSLDSDGWADPSLIVAPLNGQRYLCRLPSLTAEQDSVFDHTDAAAGAIDAKAIDRLVSLIEPLKKSCLTFDLPYAGYIWRYRYCHMDRIVQSLCSARSAKASPDSECQPMIQYLLAKYSRVPPKGLIAASTDTASDAGAEITEIEDGDYVLRQFWGSGATCDITGRPRTAELRFKCGNTEHIASVKEPSVCHYVVNIRTPRLCDQPVLQKPDQQVQSSRILCRALAPEHTPSHPPPLEDTPAHPSTVEDLFRWEPMSYMHMRELRRRRCATPTDCPDTRTVELLEQEVQRWRATNTSAAELAAETVLAKEHQSPGSSKDDGRDAEPIDFEALYQRIMRHVQDQQDALGRQLTKQEPPLAQADDTQQTDGTAQPKAAPGVGRDEL